MQNSIFDYVCFLSGRKVFMRKIIKYVLVTLLFLSLSVLTAFLIYVHFFRPGDRNLSGEWTAGLDMTKQAAVTAFIWLQDVEGVSVSLEEVEARMGKLTVEVNMELEQTGQSGGTFYCNIETESYEACEQAAYEAFAAAFRELLGERLRMAGYAKEADGETVEALVQETFGMSTVSYLRSCAPALLPSLEELQAAYDGSGTYEASGGLLVRQFDEGGEGFARTESYIRKDDRLILSGEEKEDDPDVTADHDPLVYTLRQSR